MIKAETVPEAVWRVAMMTYHREIRRNPEQAWQLAIAAAITTWPGMKPNPLWDLRTHKRSVEITLPIPSENSNERE